jgi:hypothetical protein
MWLYRFAVHKLFSLIENHACIYLSLQNIQDEKIN